MTVSLDRADVFRFADLDRTDSEPPRQEWQHFIVHGEESLLLVNFSVGDRARHGPIGRTIVLAVTGATWRGWTETHESDDVEFGTGARWMRLGSSRVEIVEGGYELLLRMRGEAVHGRMKLAAVSPHGMKSNAPLGSGRFTWLYVPRLTADGHLWVDGTRLSMSRASAYHDHNWGRFGWGEDFGWMWGSAHGQTAGLPWSVLFWRMTDRGRLRTLGQGLLLDIDGESPHLFRDSDVRFETAGLVDKPPSVFLPGVVSLTHPGSASDIPRKLDIKGRANDNWVAIGADVKDYARVWVPADTGGRDALLHEARVDIGFEGSVNGSRLGGTANGVLEVLS